jgi:uncharacterized protein (TIGR02996 family)
MQGIIDHPDEDVPRLVFADWLEEHGEPDLARYVRLLCESDRLPREDARWAGVQDELGQLERSVGKAWAAEWRQGLAEDARASLNVVEMTVRRGLYTEAVLDASAVQKIDPFRRAWEHLLTHAPIRRIHVAFVSSAIVRFLASTPTLLRLRELEVFGDDQGGGFATINSVALLARSPYLANLRRLNLRALCPWRGRQGSGSAEELAAALAESPHLAGLEKLELELMPLGEAERQRLRDRFGDRVAFGAR